MFSTNNLFLGGCVALSLLTKESLSQPQKAVATFGGDGVDGSVVISDGRMSIVLEVDNFHNIPGGKSCFTGGIFYHFHEFWGFYDINDRFGSYCGASYTGGHWDPWLGCGSATGNDYCFSQGGCALGSPVLGESHDGTYQCSNMAETNLYTCEIGDLSGIFGALDFEATDYGLEGGITVTEFFLPPPSYLKYRSIVFHCNDGTRAFCAPFILSDNDNHGSQSVKQNADSMVAIFKELDNSFIKLENDGMTDINIDISSISLPHGCGDKLNYRIYNDWTSENEKSYTFDECDCIGSFYDPTGSCAYNSDHINCINGKLCGDSHYEYNCDWNDIPSRYSCAPGDLSGKFGGLYIGDGDKYFSFSFHDQLMIQLNQLQESSKSLVLECSNSKEIIACAKFETVPYAHSSTSKPTNNNDGSNSQSSSSKSSSGSKSSSSKKGSSSGSGSGSGSGSSSSKKESSSSGKKTSSSNGSGKWSTEYGTWSSGSGKKTSGSSSGKKTSSSGSGKKVSSSSSGKKTSSSSGNNKWTTEYGTWSAGSTSGKKTSNSGSSSGKKTSSSGSSGKKTSSSKSSKWTTGSGSGSSSGKKTSSSGKKTSSSSSSSKSGDCGYGGNGEDCGYGKTATWDISQASKCNELLIQDGTSVGNVCISKVDDDNAKITYTTYSNYYLSEVNAWIGCDKDEYPKNSDNSPKLAHFPLKDEYLSDYLQSYSFHTSIKNCNGCDNLSYCDYCNTYNELLVYVIAQAKLKYYDNYNYYYTMAYMDGDFVCDYHSNFATRHALSFDVQCC